MRKQLIAFSIVVLVVVAGCRSAVSSPTATATTTPIPTLTLPPTATKPSPISTATPQIATPDDPKTAAYHIRASKLDPDAVNSYPQQIVKIISDGVPNYEVEIRIELDGDKLAPVLLNEYEYGEEVSLYLEPSTKIESDSADINTLADQIVGDESDIVTIARKAAAWTSQNIEFDNLLAQQIWDGTVDSQSALKTLETGKGTCSEYTNVFIAIMRNRGIPARFVSGYVYEGMYHAWAEFYLYGVGWIPVEAQGGFVGISDRHIKLFVGKDFVDIGVKLKEIGVVVKPINEE